MKSVLEAGPDPAGRPFSFRPGEPNFDMEVVATLREGTTGVDLYLGLPHAALAFVPAEEGFRAVFETRIRVFTLSDQGLVARASDLDTVVVADAAATGSFRPLLRHRRLPLPPGRYLVEVTVWDAGSDAEARRRRPVTVAMPSEPYLGALRLERREGTAFVPVVSPGIAGPLTLRVVVEARGVPAVVMRLLRFRRDTTVALPPYALSPLSGSMRYQGVRYDRADTLQTARRAAAGALHVLAFPVPALSEGVYRVEVDGGGEVLRRDLVVFPPDFPRINTLDVMAEALAYLADEGAYRHILAASNPMEKKRRFDAFWGRLIENRTRAANLINAYYSRAEEANLRFTSVKEGWKTDRGMVFIILGEPLRIEHRPDAEVWHYDYAEGGARTFVFERVRVFGGGDAFVNYVLRREGEYLQVWTRAVRRWRQGEGF